MVKYTPLFTVQLVCDVHSQPPYGLCYHYKLKQNVVNADVKLFCYKMFFD